MWLQEHFCPWQVVQARHAWHWVEAEALWAAGLVTRILPTTVSFPTPGPGPYLWTSVSSAPRSDEPRVRLEGPLK